jgi:hypothetical protein
VTNTKGTPSFFFKRGAMNSNSNNNGYDAIGQLPIELPLLQHHGSNVGGHQQLASTNFYQTPYYSSDPNTPSTASSGAYSSLIHGYNPYSAITPQFELIFPGYPWHFAAAAAVDIGSEVPLPNIDHQNTATTAPLFSQTLSPLHSTANNSTTVAAVAMTRYSRTSQNPRRGGRRPREEYEPPALNEEDRDKRDKRRQRNKEAAARCRQRRLDLMQTLQRDKDLLEQQNNQMEMQYNTLKKGMEDIVQSLRAHSSNCNIRDNNLMQQLDVLTETLRGPSYQTNGHQQQSQQVQGNSNNSNTLLPPASLLSSSKRKAENIGGQLQYPQQPVQQQQQQQQYRFPRPNTLPLSGLNLKDESIGSPGSSSIEDPLLYDSPDVKRHKFEDESPPERPTTLSLIQTWGQTPSIVTPSNGMPQFSEFFKNNFPEEYNMLNQQTFLTPIVPNAISVSSASMQPPPQSEDLQDL